VAPERKEFLAGSCLPEEEPAESIAGRDEPAIGAKRDGRHPVGRLANGVPDLAARTTEDFDMPARASEDDAGAVAAQVGGEDRVEFVTERLD
jgi:hypothetical protein